MMRRCPVPSNGVHSSQVVSCTTPVGDLTTDKGDRDIVPTTQCGLAPDSMVGCEKLVNGDSSSWKCDR